MLCRLSYASKQGREIFYYTNTVPYCNGFPTIAEKKAMLARGQGARATRSA
jgi:hypothetical protein